MRHRRPVRTICAALLAIVLLPLTGTAFLHQPRMVVQRARLFDQVLHLVSERYVDSVSTDTLYEKAALGVIKELHDPFSSFFTPSEFTRFNNTMLSHYAGLGIQIAADPTGIFVQRVFPNTPAAASGVLTGDQIVAVDTFSTVGWSVQEVSDKIQGLLGTPLTMTVLHTGQQQPVVMRLERSIVNIPTVPYALVMDETVGYIPLLQFGDRAETELANAIADVVRRGATSLIIDLRGDPGGLLQQAVDVSSLFLPLGTPVVTLHSRVGNTVYHVMTTPAQPNIPLVLLVDGHTASASEIVAGALQDHDRALVIGVPTFGKGVAQELFTVDGGYVLRLTSAKWYTPNGRLIHRDRTMLENGKVVELHPDSFPGDLSGRGRPMFSSDAGRLLYGGGGIMPDLIVANDDMAHADMPGPSLDSTAARRSLGRDRPLQQAITLLKESVNQKTLFGGAEQVVAKQH